MSINQNQKNIVNDAIIKELIEAVNSLDYGYVHITIHNSKIVQIDKTEKTRFDDVWLIEKGGGI
ncbi:MAG: YezD family protein [Candidatus Omnitrophota bacterium]|nr:YezD family protein [Candidatus Omnitrophota bacterium]